MADAASVARSLAAQAGGQPGSQMAVEWVLALAQINATLAVADAIDRLSAAVQRRDAAP
jgi:aryl-alcohol dehydrogenase-like predicted oxidoreductase